MLPRPDLARLAIAYRRIPLLAIGRDVYLDTRLILRKLEGLPGVAAPPLGVPPSGRTEALALERLLSVLTTSTDLFAQAAALLPESLPLMQDPLFRRDRRDFFHGGQQQQQQQPGSDREGHNRSDVANDEGREGGGEDALEQAALRAEALHALRTAFHLVEHTLLADGRRWILGDHRHTPIPIPIPTPNTNTTPNHDPKNPDSNSTNNANTAKENSGPSLADIEAVWLFHWLTGLPGALDPAQVSRTHFPRVYAWVARFQAAVGAAKGSVDVRSMGGEEAASFLLSASFSALPDWSLGEDEGCGDGRGRGRGEGGQARRGEDGEREGEREGEGGVGYYYEREDELHVDATEPIARVYGLRKGSVVEVWPTDSGAAHRDRGRLLGLGADELVWETDAGVRVHAPRVGFRVRSAAVSAGVEEV